MTEQPLQMLLLYFLQELVPLLGPEFMSHILCYTYDSLLHRLSASLGKVLGATGSHGGYTETSASADRMVTGSWCSSPWSPSSFKWRKWDFATMESCKICPEMESSPVLKAGETVEVFFLCLIRWHTGKDQACPYGSLHWRNSFSRDPHPHLKPLCPLV